MYNFEYYIPTKVLFGAGTLGQLHCEKLPGKKALIVTSAGQSVKRFGYLDALTEQLELSGVDYAVFSGVRSNPSAENVMEGVAAFRENGCDFFCALGGGSVMDSAKAMAMVAANGGDIWDYSQSKNGGKRTPEKPIAPLVCITTSAGTGSEVGIDAVISNDKYNEKTSIFYPQNFPTLSVVDSDLMLTVPKELTAYQGMDAFFHASESVINRFEHPMGEMFALKAIELIAKALPRAYRDGGDREARSDMALANSLAGYYMLCTSAHSMEHVMGGFHKSLVHGAGLIEIAHEYYDFFAQRKAAEEPMIKMARAMGVEDASSGSDFVKALDELIASVGCDNLKMSDDGITFEELSLYPAKIHEVLGGDIDADPIKLSDEDYLGIYQRSFK